MYPYPDPYSERRIRSTATRRTPWLLVLLVALLAGFVGAAIGAGVVLAQFPTETEYATDPAPTTAAAVLPASSETLSVDIHSAITEAVEEAAPAVVTVINNMGTRTTMFGEQYESTSSGSGVFISADGYLITNQHVVEDAVELAVIFSNGERRPAELVGEDRYDDLAVLHVEGNIPAYIEWGNSDNLKAGETVIAIGSPLGAFQNTVTVGVVSATDRSIDVSETYELQGMIQTDAAINQGNSGGPLINLEGQLIGINTLIVRGSSTSAPAEGLGFAIQSNTARAISTQLINEGHITRPYIGIRWGWITPEIARRYNLPVEYGVFLTDVIAGGPADEAGLEINDIIVAINGITLDDSQPYTNILFEYKPGDVITLTVYHDGENLTIPITLGERIT